MNLFFYKNRKKIIILGISLILFGAILAYLKWGIEPEETIAGVFFGVGLSISIFAFSLKGN